MNGFKFLKAAHADLMMQGKLRLSHAHTFRVADGLSEIGRSDEREMLLESYIPGGQATLPSNHPIFGGTIRIMVNGVQIVTDMMVAGETIAHLGNALLYCISSIDTQELRGNMLKHFGSDACVEIVDLDKFAAEVSAHPLLQKHEMLSGPVIYRELVVGSVLDVTGVQPFEKKPEFSWQSEFRFVWSGPLPDTDYLDLEVPTIRQYLRRVL
jgi:hypothetical protein